jgi:6-pyruvoyltetrahydropterin/6-carboxytetrahydropterin synthase
VSRWVIHAEATFEARHALTSYRGKRESSHGHQWKVAVRVGAEALNDEGYALDFHQVRDLLAAAVAPLDRSDLNEHPEIGTPSPTAERIAEVLSAKLADVYQDIGGNLLWVSVWEGPDNRVDLVLDAADR